MTSERLFNSFIPPKNFYTPQKNKFLATPLLEALLLGARMVAVSLPSRVLGRNKEIWGQIFVKNILWRESWGSL